MHDRNILSRVKGFAGFLLGTLASLGAAPVYAEGGNPSFPLISMLSPTPATASIDNALAILELRATPVVARTVDLTAQHDDLWIRLRNGFAMTNLNDDLTLHYQQWYQNRPDALRRMVERSRPYLHHIVEELEARGMPTEIALLPMVESSFNPMAYSRSHASGLWQFIPATGKRFNLEQTWWQDQRRDVVASTGAALEYLQTIYEMHGDWHLALASYNWGEGAVKRAIEKNAARGLPTDDFALLSHSVEVARPLAARPRGRALQYLPYASLRWYADRADRLLPHAVVWSLPVLAYKLFMLLWSLFLAVSLVGYLPWAYRAFSEWGLWRPVPRLWRRSKAKTKAKDSDSDSDSDDDSDDSGSTQALQIDRTVLGDPDPGSK